MHDVVVAKRSKLAGVQFPVAAPSLTSSEACRTLSGSKFTPRLVSEEQRQKLFILFD